MRRRIQHAASIALFTLAALAALPALVAPHAAKTDNPAPTPESVRMKEAGISVVHYKGKTIFMIPTDLPQTPYKIGPSDVLGISVWEDPQLTQSVNVQPDGNIALPLIGEIHAGGMTVPALRDEITRRLNKYVRKPIVTVTVKDPLSHHYNIMGQVMHPGSFTIRHTTRVLDAIAAAGGFQDFAKPDKIYVLRRMPGGPMVKVFFQYHKVIQGLRMNENIQLRQGDVIVVP